MSYFLKNDSIHNRNVNDFIELTTYLSTYMHTYQPTCTPTYLHAHLPTYMQTYLPTCTPTYLMHTYLPTCTPMYIHGVWRPFPCTTIIIINIINLSNHNSTFSTPWIIFIKLFKFDYCSFHLKYLTKR